MNIKSELLKRGKKIPFKIFNEGGREHYNVRIFVEGDLAKIKKVKYKLVPGFPNPERVSTDRLNNFAIEIWTWGVFPIDVTVYLNDGSSEEFEHNVDYDLPADTGKNYLDES